MDWLHIRVLQDAFLSGLALPMSHEVVYYAALAFGVGGSAMLFALGVLGASGAMALNMLAGHFLQEMNLTKEHPKFLKMQRFLNRYGVWLLAIPGVVLHGLFALLLMAAGVRWQRVAIACAISITLRYGVTAFISHNTDIVQPLLKLFS